MRHTVARRGGRAAPHDDRRNDLSQRSWSNSASNLKSDNPIEISVDALPDSIGVQLKNPCPNQLTLEELEAIIPQEYSLLTPWTARKLCLDYGVCDLRNPDLPGGPHLQIVAPIADELVHDTIVLLWEKAKGQTVELSNASHVRGWLKKALKFALLQWAQEGAREYERRVYSVEAKDEEQDSIDAEIIEFWDADNRESVWHKIELVFDRAIGDCPSAPSEQEQTVSNEVDAALQLLPHGLQKLINQAYREQVSWRDAGVPVDIEGQTLEREMHRWLRTLRPYIPSYQLSKRWVRDTRRARKSFHCPICDMPVRRQKGNNGGGCTRCQMRIHEDQFAIKYFYHV